MNRSFLERLEEIIGKIGMKWFIGLIGFTITTYCLRYLIDQVISLHLLLVEILK